LRLWDVDPKTTDKERADWDVPTLDQLHENVNNLNKTFDIEMVDMKNKPQWLKDAINRWNSRNN